MVILIILQNKTLIARNAVRHVTSCLEENEWLKDQMKANDGLMCPLEDMAPSPVQQSYRNKCEFTIGSPTPGEEGKVIGFRIGSYRDGDLSVVPPVSCLHVPDKVKEIVKTSQMFIEGSKHSAFNPVNHSGHWAQLAVRSYCSGETMVTFQFHPQSLTPDVIEEEKERLRVFFSTGPGAELKVTSLYFYVQGRRLPGNQSSGKDELLLGAEHVHEQLLGLRFRISREAFFQVNTLAAEVLYKILGEWCRAWPSVTLYDICCGTGTIGLCLSKSVEKVVGIEMIPEAVEDAVVNAKTNGIENASFHCGKAEDVLPELIKTETSNEVIGILDPPRGGIGTRVINAVRKCEGLNRLLYISCDPENKSAISNFVALCRHRTKHTPGKPFRALRAIPVDLFPQTRHYELVILFER
jgi:tRNA (uracil-5-)-methyltransferase